jgi:E3 ubiquitin-protein ligase RNF19A
MEKKFQGWASGNINISYCPKCKTRVEKVEGCNHMTCYFCQFQWCWICGGTYTDDHYVPINPFGCGNQQFAKKHVWYIQIWI